MTHSPDDRLLDLLEGSLTGAEGENLRGHLAECSDCRVRLEHLASVEALAARSGARLADAPELTVPDEVEAKLLGAVNALNRPTSLVHPWQKRLIWRLSLAGGLAGLVAVLYASVGPHSRQEGEALALLLDNSAAQFKTRGEAERGGGDGRTAPSPGSAAAEIRRGSLRVSATRVPNCTPGELVRYGAFDSAGRLRVYAVRIGDAREIHLYAEDGSESFSAVADGRGTRRGSGLRRNAAEAALASTRCEPSISP